MVLSFFVKAYDRKRQQFNPWGGKNMFVKMLNLDTCMAAS